MAKKPAAKKETASARTAFEGDGPHAKHASRVLDTLHELNKAMEEARKDGALIFVDKCSTSDGGLHLTCKIYRLTHTTMVFEAEITPPAN